MKRLFYKLVLVGLTLGLIAPLQADNALKMRALVYTAGLTVFGLWAKKQIILNEKERRDKSNNLTEAQKELKRQLEKKSKELQALNKEIEEQHSNQIKNAKPCSLWELQLQKFTSSSSQINIPNAGEKIAVSRLRSEVEKLNQELTQINQQIEDNESRKKQAEKSNKQWTQAPLATKAFIYSLLTAGAGLFITSGFTLFNNILDSI